MVPGQEDREEGGDTEDEGDGDGEDGGGEEGEQGKVVLSAHSREVHTYLEHIQRWSARSRRIVVKRLLEQIVTKQSAEQLQIFKNVLQDHGGVTEEERTPAVGEVKSKDVSEIADDDEFEDNVGGEVSDVDNDEVDHFVDNGKFNQKNHLSSKKDKSNEEVRSSWSSSEEALAACEGAVFNIALNGATSCHQNASFAEMRPVMDNISYTTDTAGFYYFIFTNENEITSNFVAASFEMHKTTFDVRSAEDRCLNTTDCALHLSFFSRQHVVIEVSLVWIEPSIISYFRNMSCRYDLPVDPVCEHISYRFLKVRVRAVITRRRA